MEYNRHHILFPRKLHDANQDTKVIRRNPWLIPKIAVVGHMALHDEVTTVPPLDRFSAQRVNRAFVPIRGNHILSIEALMFAIDEAIQHPKVRAIEIENAQVAIHALELQIPFIKEFLIQD